MSFLNFSWRCAGWLCLINFFSTWSGSVSDDERHRWCWQRWRRRRRLQSVVWLSAGTRLRRPALVPLFWRPRVCVRPWRKRNRGKKNIYFKSCIFAFWLKTKSFNPLFFIYFLPKKEACLFWADGFVECWFFTELNFIKKVFLMWKGGGDYFNTWNTKTTKTKWSLAEILLIEFFKRSCVWSYINLFFPFLSVEMQL